MRLLNIVFLLAFSGESIAGNDVANTADSAQYASSVVDLGIQDFCEPVNYKNCAIEKLSFDKLETRPVASL